MGNNIAPRDSDAIIVYARKSIKGSSGQLALDLEKAARQIKNAIPALQFPGRDEDQTCEFVEDMFDMANILRRV